MQSSTESSTAASIQGPALFHAAVARYKQMTSANVIVSAARTHSAETAYETADETSSVESIYELAKEYPDAATGPDAANDNTTTMLRKHDSMFTSTRGQAATSSTIGILSPRPQRKWLRHSLLGPEGHKQQHVAPCTRAAETALDHDDDDDDDDDGNGESIAHMRECMQTGLACLDVHQQQVEQILADMHAQDIAAARERAWGPQIRAARDMRMSAAERLRNPIVAQVVSMAPERLARRAVVEAAVVPARRSRAYRDVAEVLPMAARGTATSDGAEIRRHAARRVDEQMVPDSSYPRFHPSPRRR